MKLAQFVSILDGGYAIGPPQDPLGLSAFDAPGAYIGPGVWMGVQSVLLPGRSIGTGAVVGAGSIVTIPVPEYTIAVGNPIRIIRSRHEISPR